MRPHRSGFQLYTSVCVQVGEAMVYQIRRDLRREAVG
jgi:hypothetical protein